MFDIFAWKKNTSQKNNWLLEQMLINILPND